MFSKIEAELPKVGNMKGLDSHCKLMAEQSIPAVMAFSMLRSSGSDFLIYMTARQR